ncbi:uncharacterized protein LOC135154065 [Lytechinus pictus]|uniref:uncharacterized protein LOC135154065 n=1 Tax=Lytechinus pictus TaxID=7653 RepID=UPI0030B9AE33
MAGRDHLISLYFNLGMSYKEIIYILAQEHGIELSERHLKRILALNNFRRRHYTNLADVVQFIEHELQGSGQLHGYRMMHAKCRQNGMHVRKEDVRVILKYLDPEGVAARTARRLTRRSYFAKGPNHVWHVDGYDKLKPFGLCISGCIDGYSRKVMWLNVYNTNNDPKLVGGYFLETVMECGGFPCKVRADRGTENGHICAFQNFFHHNYDLERRVYIEGSSTSNQRIEYWWAFLRKECTHFWIETFRRLSDRGDFTGDFLDKNLVQFCFMSILQTELDKMADIWNNHRIRPSVNLHVPSGHPMMMYHTPQIWGTEDQLCTNVDDDDLAACISDAVFRSTIPCDKDVYDLCVYIMKRDNLDQPMEVQDALELYIHLKQEITVLL